jgi:hypothetical protein
MPDNDVMNEQESDIQVEVIPEPEEERPRLKTGDTRQLDVRDEEIKGYGREVQDRIKKLRFAFHEERRQKEQKERDLVSTTDYAQRLHKENLELKKNVQRTEAAVVHQAMSRVDVEIERARAISRQALESGHSDQIVDSQEKLARAVAEKERLAILQSSPPEEEKETVPPPQPPADERTQQWFAKNVWWRKPGHEKRTHYALGVHEELAARGVTPTSQPDLYWKTIDEELTKVFPEHSANGNGNSNGYNADRDERDSPNSRPLAVAGGTRSSAGAAGNAGRTRVIRLNESQVRLARRIGLTPEQYAHQLAVEQEAGNG